MYAEHLAIVTTLFQTQRHKAKIFNYKNWKNPIAYSKSQFIPITQEHCIFTRSFIQIIQYQVLNFTQLSKIA